MSALMFLKRVVVIILFVYGGAMVLLYVRQDQLIFIPDHPTREIVATPASLGLKFEEHVFNTSDQQRIHAWFVPNDKSRSVILVCHGNAGNISHRLDTLQRFHQIGLNVLLFDYRGFGQSSGEPGEAGSYLDAEAAWDFLIRKSFSPKQIIIFGRSLGGGIASELATRKPAAAVILESTFTSIADRGAEIYPWLPIRFLVRTQYDSLEKVPRITAPLLILHSQEDEIIPFHHGESLYRAAREPKSFYRLSGGHNDGWRLTDGYLPTIAGFLRQHLAPQWYP